MAESVEAYKDRNYSQKKALYDVLSQALQNIKYGTSQSSFSTGTYHGGTSWNKPTEEVKGVTMRLLGGDTLELTYHHYEVTTVEGLQRDVENKFLKEVEKALKKEFKALTGKTLKLKQTNSDRNIEKASRISAESSWLLGSSRYGHGSRPVGRYLVRDYGYYEFGASLE